MEEEKKKKNPVKTIKTIAIILLVVIVFVCIYIYFTQWPIRYSSKLDDFFGEGNWEVISQEKKESNAYVEHHTDSNGYSYDTPGTYREWDILCTNDETEEVWTISNLGYKVNNSKYSIFSSKRKSKKQALTQELMDISCIIAAEEVENLLSEVLTDEQIDCLRVEILYNGGNPPPSFYTKLAKQDWFTVTGTTAKEYLETDLYDFYIDIFAHDYRVSNLPEDEQSDLMESLNDIEQLLIDTYGEYADYRIYLGDGYLAETQ